MNSIVEQIRARWKNRGWPNIAYFTHGQAVMDIDTLLAEIDLITAQHDQQTAVKMTKGELSLNLAYVFGNIVSIDPFGGTDIIIAACPNPLAAAGIVRRYNEHDDLVKALDKTVKMLQWIIDNESAHPNNIRAVAKEGFDFVKELGIKQKGGTL